MSNNIKKCVHSILNYYCENYFLIHRKLFKLIFGLSFYKEKLSMQTSVEHKLFIQNLNEKNYIYFSVVQLKASIIISKTAN